MGKKRAKKKQNRVVTERLVEQVNNDTEELESKSEDASEKFSDTISVVLYEDYNEVASITDQEENIPQSDEPQEEVVVEEKIERPNKFYLVFAVFVIVMSIIGIISSARFCVTTVKEIANQTSLKNEIALFLYPIVTVDPPEFSEMSEIPSSVIIESAIWRIILTGDNTNYEKLYNTYMYVPAVDVEFSIKSIYGNSAVIAHQSVGSASATFTFDEAMNAYLVPISPRYTAYSPVVADISNVGELYTVTVEYMPPTALAIEGIKLENTTTKTMIYTLSKSKKNMVVHSAKNATNLGDVNVY